MQLLSCTTLAVLALCASMLLTAPIEGASTPQQSNYIAAVVEYKMSHVGATKAAELTNRVNEYAELIKKAAAQNADIIVFPESALTEDEQAQIVPDADEKVTPCGNATYAVLSGLSCAVRDAKLYAVINLVMQRKCDAKVNGKPCNGTVSLYNTNVVLDRSGTVISL